MGVGNQIKKLLKEKNMTILELSQTTGISKNTLYAITKRDSKRVSYVNLLKIAKALNVDISDLVFYGYGDETFWEDMLWEEIALEDENIQGEYSKLMANKEEKSKIITLFHKLNSRGRQKALEQVELLTKIPEYREDNN